MILKQHVSRAFADHTWYMISAATTGGTNFFAGDTAKWIFRDHARALFQKFNTRLMAWVILDNHYHLLLKTRNGTDLPPLMAQLHEITAAELNSLDGVPDRTVWNNYWDTLLPTQADLGRAFNYVHQNPVKHSYVLDPKEWPFSSYPFYLQAKGEEWLRFYEQQYPVDDFVDIDEYRTPTSLVG